MRIETGNYIIEYVGYETINKNDNDYRMLLYEIEFRNIKCPKIEFKIDNEDNILLYNYNKNKHIQDNEKDFCVNILGLVKNDILEILNFIHKQRIQKINFK